MGVGFFGEGFGVLWRCWCWAGGRAKGGGFFFCLASARFEQGFRPSRVEWSAVRVDRTKGGRCYCTVHTFPATSVARARKHPLHVFVMVHTLPPTEKAQQQHNQKFKQRKSLYQCKSIIVSRYYSIICLRICNFRNNFSSGHL